MTAATPKEGSAHAARAAVTAAGHDVVDRTRDRTATLNQLLLTAVVLVTCSLMAVAPLPGDAVRFFLGVVMVVIVTGATLVVPWNALPSGWVAVVPALDIVAIAVMQLAVPDSRLGLLWIFPVMWLASGFGVPGLCAVVAAIAGISGILSIISAREVTDRTLLLPLVLFAVAITAHLTARRSDAQRTLLARQSQLLRSVLARSRRQEQVVTEVLDAVDFGIVRIDPDGRTAVTNDAHGRLQQGLEPHDTSEVPVFRDDGTSPLPPEDLPLERARRGESFDDEVVWFGVEPGVRRALTVTARRLTDPDGADAGAVVVSRDITAELEARRARDELVASVSHELRTPLTSILGYLDLAIEDPDTPDAVRANLDIAERNAERLLQIVADVLAASRSSASAFGASLAPAALDASEIVHAAATDAATRAAARAITIDTSGLEPARVWADALRLRQVVDNLVSNAITYNRDGGAIHVGTTSDGNWSWILVRDTGIGISEADRARVFHRYYKAGAERRAGTGLGLAITRDIVRAHGGEIGLHSSPGVGSTFIVKLPATPPEGAAQ
jgi:signal transduction histidine kinase